MHVDVCSKDEYNNFCYQSSKQSVQLMVNAKIQSINEDCFHLSKLHCFKPDLTV